jgi:hypothetical protein
MKNLILIFAIVFLVCPKAQPATPGEVVGKCLAEIYKVVPVALGNNLTSPTVFHGENDAGLECVVSINRYPQAMHIRLAPKANLKNKLIAQFVEYYMAREAKCDVKAGTIELYQKFQDESYSSAEKSRLSVALMSDDRLKVTLTDIGTFKNTTRSCTIRLN